MVVHQRDGFKQAEIHSYESGVAAQSPGTTALRMDTWARLVTFIFSGDSFFFLDAYTILYPLKIQKIPHRYCVFACLLILPDSL